MVTCEHIVFAHTLWGEGRCGASFQKDQRARHAYTQYADFSTSYLSGLEKLEKILKNYGAHTIPIPPEQQLIPLSFTRGIYLQDVPLDSRVASLIQTLPAGYHFKRNQFVLDNPDKTYLILRERLTQRMEHIAEDSYYVSDSTDGQSVSEPSLYTTDVGFRGISGWSCLKGI